MAVKVIGDPVRPDAVAVRVFAPAVVPRVHEVTAAIPEEFVVAEPPTTVPAPVATAKVTERPETGLPPESVTRTDGTVVTALPAVALWLFPALSAMVAADPAPVGCTVVVADVRPDAAKVSVCVVEERPANVTPEKVATPEVAETVVVPPKVPVPAVTVTEAVDELTVLPLASTTRTTGCVDIVAPDAPATGCVEMDSAEAAPATIQTVGLDEIAVPSTVAETTAWPVVAGAVNVALKEPPPLSVTDPSVPMFADIATVRPVADTGLPATSRS